VSTLLLDGTFKPATPLTNGVINELLQQFALLSDISQNSVATHFRCGGIFSDGYTGRQRAKIGSGRVRSTVPVGVLTRLVWRQSSIDGSFP